MTIILTIIKLLIVLGIVATIHEFGHFLFAKLFKMTVNEFSIGFGPKIVSWGKKTKYSLRWIPLGGYVAIEGEEGNSEDENAFSNKSPWKRIIVLVAGVTFNAILATAIFIGVNLSTPTFGTKVQNLDNNGAAYVSGIREGDIITKIGNTKTHVYQDVALYNSSEQKDVEVKYIRDGKEYTTILKDVVKNIGYIGVYFDTSKTDDDGRVLAYVQMVEPGMPASYGKIKAGDLILKVNGEDVKYSSEVYSIISKNIGKEIDIIVLRNDKEIALKVKPENKVTVNLGFISFEKENTTLTTAYYKSITTIKQIVGSYVDLFCGKVKMTQLSGIVGIGEVISKTKGITEFLQMMGMISLAVGIANILPFPPLDGGKVVLVLIEWITKKKVSPKVEAILSYIGFGLLILLTIYVTINDIIRIV